MIALTRGQEESLLPILNGKQLLFVGDLLSVNFIQNVQLNFGFNGQLLIKIIFNK